MKPGLVGITSALMVVGFALQSCAADVSLGLGLDDAGVEEAGSSTPSFTPPPDAGLADAELTPAEPLKECIGTECVWPRATCGDGSIARCNVDLLTDNNNCGECGHKCEQYIEVSLGSQCMGGKCRPFCTHSSLQDCNGLVDDGCEADVSSNTENCGTCGNKCPEGIPCRNGTCTCGDGMVVCNGECVDLATDDNNCGACGNACEFVAEPCAPKDLPPNTRYKCAKGQCGQFVCSSSDRKDCNGDLKLGCNSTDGCEVEVSTDPNNCGACGNKCAPGQFCRNYMGSNQCVCGPGETACGDIVSEYGLFDCVDVMTDAKNCGGCGHACPSAPNANAVCRSGICGLECPPNRADCNGDWADGCEVDLLSNMRNCGACGQACDVDGGQPCINGSCLMVECDAGITTH